MTDKEIFWSRFASEFDKGSYYVVGKNSMETILAETATLKDLKNALELGCGAGLYSKILAKASDKLLATDFSDEMVEVAKKNLASFDDVKVEKANCLSLPYADNSFDTVLMTNLLHVIDLRDDAIVETRRVLKQGGRIVVISYTPEGMKLFSKMALIYRYTKNWGKPPSSRSPLGIDTTRQILETAGFKIIRSRLAGEAVKAVFVEAVNDKKD